MDAQSSESEQTTPAAKVVRGVQPNEPPYPSKLRAWFAVAVLMGIYINSFLDRQILSLLVEDIKGSLALSDTQMGMIMGPAFAIFYSVAGLPIGWLVDRKSRPLIIIVGHLYLCQCVDWSRTGAADRCTGDRLSVPR